MRNISEKHLHFSDNFQINYDLPQRKYFNDFFRIVYQVYLPNLWPIKAGSDKIPHLKADDMIIMVKAIENFRGGYGWI
jgi:hypothetical protein